MWVLSRDDVVIKPKRVIDTKTFMATIIWNLHGFRVVDLLPDGSKFNMTYFLDNIVAPLQSVIFPAGRKKQERKLLLHIDN
jgi:hypothetical protein